MHLTFSEKELGSISPVGKKARVMKPQVLPVLEPLDHSLGYILAVLETEFGEEDATKQKSVKRSAFFHRPRHSVNEGFGKGTGKGIQ